MMSECITRHDVLFAVLWILACIAYGVVSSWLWDRSKRATRIRVEGEIISQQMDAWRKRNYRA